MLSLFKARPAVISLLLSFLLVGLGEAAATKYHGDRFVPDIVLSVTKESYKQACLPARPTVLVNGTSPGPELRIKEGQTYWIRVINHMTSDNLTMHWHGLSMAVSPFSDGTPSASQWPIPPAHFFDYEIQVPVGMAGTYFYHSHVGLQAITAAGPLIVEEASGICPYQYDDEKIIFIQDVLGKDDATLEAGLVATPLVWSGEASMILVNGKGGGTANGTACNASLSVIDVEPGKTYRLRFVGATGLTFTSLAIEGHEDLEIIEADGSYTQKHSKSFLQVGSGQRFSALLTTKATPEKSSYIIQLESRDRPTLTRSFAILNYGKKPTGEISPPATPPLTLPPTEQGFLDYDLSALHPDPDFPKASEVTRRVIITAHQHIVGKTVWLSNGFAWNDGIPTEPYLISLYKDATKYFPDMGRALANKGIDPVTKTFPAQLGEVLEIVIQNTGSDAGGVDAHPWHAHGEHYFDLGSGNGTYNSTANEKKLATVSQPVRRDTTILHKYAAKASNNTEIGWRAWRLRVKEPGVWMIHCHILPHMIMGMQTVWVMGNEAEVLSLQRPEVDGYLAFGGNVMGNGTHWPTVVDYYGNWEGTQ